MMGVTYGEHMGEERGDHIREVTDSLYIGDLEHCRFAGVADSTRCPISPYTIYGSSYALVR